MRCEIVAVGTELLLGQIVDTNSSWMGEQLALAGIDSHYQTKVGDNLDRMVDSIRLALGRSDAVILCGGLGPTQDDITREAIAAVMGVALVRDEAIVERIRKRFERRGRTMSDNNRRQADVPEGASLIPEMPGTAPGLVCPVGAKMIYAVPGVPREMREMVLQTILPDLRRRAGDPGVIRSRVLRTWGHSESGLAEILGDRITELDRTGNPTLAFQASGIEGIKVRITTKSAHEDDARMILDEEETRIRGMLGETVFAIDDDTMETTILSLLAERGLTLAVAEVPTGGLAAARLSQADREGRVFAGGVTCSPMAETPVLDGVDSFVGDDSAATMADAVRRMFNTSIGLACAGPADEADRERGTVYAAVADGGDPEIAAVHLPGRMDQARDLAVVSLLNMLRLRLVR